MDKIVLSAFSRFGDYTANCTEMVARNLHRQELAGFKIHSKVFKAMIPQMDRARELFRLAWRVQAKGIICLGMDSSKTGLCIETKAKNRVYHERYTKPNENNICVRSWHRYGRIAKANLAPWNVRGFQSACKKHDVSVSKVSNKVNGFCCNHLMYQMLTCPKTYRSWQGPFIFIHVPCSPETVPDVDVFLDTGKIMMMIPQIIAGIGLLLEHSHLSSS